MTMSSIPPTIPFDVAKTYGVRAPGVLSVRPLSQPPAAELARSGAQSDAQTVARIERADKADLSRVTEGIGRLLGARVEQPAFEGLSTPTPQANSMAFYHHPADHNAAATGVSLGQSLDISG
jgi:hypothetical protein